MVENDDRSIPNPASNTSKAEGERWTSDPDTVERRDRDTTFERTTGEGGGITNRPLPEEHENQEALPDRGSSRPGAHAGHGASERLPRDERTEDR